MYEPVTTPALRLHMLKSVTDTINMSLIFQSGDSLIVFDGGYASETDYLFSYLKALQGRVKGWFFTHVHDDHICAAAELMKKYGNKIPIDKVYYHFPSSQFLDDYEPNQDAMSTRELLSHFHTAIAGCHAEKVTVDTGDRFSFPNIEVTVLRTPDEAITVNPINNSSVCYRVEAGGSSILILGDLGAEGGRQLLAQTDPGLLRADYVQMAHHGQSGVERDVYEAIHPDYCLWCTPSWLWDNIGAGGYDTGGYRTIITRGWMSEMGIKKHYIMKDGTQVIDL